ncbi:glycogen/starch synthase [Ravibacter arvi]|uniref:Glycogen/starch synthase n=2 Tax=Ravibacter arvi TaxID=2051041 RepID=A0ABP8M494_9BACT
MVEKWGENYFLLGPYFAAKAASEFEPITDWNDSPAGKAAKKLHDSGIDVHYGYWLVTGKPRVLLFDFNSIRTRLEDIKFRLWENHKISTLHSEDLVNQVVLFGECIREFLKVYCADNYKKQEILSQFHEWMASSSLPDLVADDTRMASTFTTHATMLGRYLAQNVQGFYSKLPFFDWQQEAKNFGIEAQAGIERKAAQSAQVLTTVSDVTARECEVFLGRKPDLVTPNGLNVQRFQADHEFHNLHVKYKEKIHEFVMGHFFQNYSFDLDKTLYFFTSGRFEFSNKGYDLTLEAMARLNWKMVQANMDTTVVLFIVTKQPYHSINPDVLQSRAMLEEIHQTCTAIEKQVGERLFLSAASGDDNHLPDLNQFVDEYWRLRLRRTIQTWKTPRKPAFVTHDLVNRDDIVDYCEKAGLTNNEQDRVKIVYHPDFITYTNPLFGLDYGQFVRGCHLGVFPSYYEPWGYTPLECVVRGVPTVTSDLSGFGDYIMQIMRDFENRGIYVINRKSQTFSEAAEQMANILFRFVRMTRRERISQRNRVENIADVFDWNSLRSYYDTAHDLAARRKKPGA